MPTDIASSFLQAMLRSAGCGGGRCQAKQGPRDASAGYCLEGDTPPKQGIAGCPALLEWCDWLGEPLSTAPFAVLASLSPSRFPQQLYYAEESMRRESPLHCG